MLSLNQVTKTFGTQTLFENLDLKLDPNSRIGLIGRNGCGKSTILKMIAGIEEPTSGSLYRMPGLRVGYLSQEPQVTLTNTLEEEIRTAFVMVNALLEQEQKLVDALQIPDLTPEMQGKYLDQLDQVLQDLERFEARSVDARIGRVLKGLSFTQEDQKRLVSEFSGGWQMRINLAKILLEPPDLFILDEPTNHLDLEACEWLESYLKQFKGAVVVVSHDRRFLDQVTTEIAEIELGELTLWPGNYSTHLVNKAEMIEQLQESAERQDKELAKQQAFINRFRASATRSTQAKSREKLMAKVERIATLQTDKRQMRVHFTMKHTSGRQVYAFKNISKSYGDKVLFHQQDAEIQRTQRIFLLGPNGCGKTTLLKLILDLESLDEGEIKPGHQVLTGYFSQNQLETLDPNLTIFETMYNACPHMSESQVRAMLGRFLFTGDDARKVVSVLSGGEKSKLALATLMAEGPNTLLLDEPTNHMDISAKEVLEDAFLEYPGTIFCISHDRYFIQTLATNIWEIYAGQILQYPGDYDYYLSKREELRAQALLRESSLIAKALEKQASRASSSSTEKPLPPTLSEETSGSKAKIQVNIEHVELESATTKANGKQSDTGLSPLQIKREIEKKITKIEKEIIKVEEGLAQVEKQMAESDLQNNYEALEALSAKAGEKHQLLESLNHQWEALTNELLAYSV
ncbi:MAG: ABC-F family ATP-binding cassette domain-containing protein [Cyanobacteria bacterium]|nr:ABC-F family ATP-binding cassette domain-containing protein [Cyanobacteriota bacterium]